jgi:multidrug resistance efflux pump
MGEPGLLRGHVASIVSAIEDRDRAEGSNLLPNVNPAFSWVRLAQRIPVRVALDDIPKDFRMIAGRTATVSVRGLAPPGGTRGAVDHTASSAAQAGSPASAQAAAEQPAVQPSVQPAASAAK